MLTSVKKDILDNSISGDKIHGGSIDSLDYLETNVLRVPCLVEEPSSGAGHINGSGFFIGDEDYIGFIGSKQFSARGPNPYYRILNDANIAIASLYSNSGYGELLLKEGNNAASVRISSRLSNYLTRPLIVGAISGLGATDMFGVFGGDLLCNRNGKFNDVLFKRDGNYISLEGFYSDFLIVGSIVGSYASDLDNISNTLISNLNSIDPSVFPQLEGLVDFPMSNDDWERASSDTPVFVNGVKFGTRNEVIGDNALELTISDISANGAIEVVGGDEILSRYSLINKMFTMFVSMSLAVPANTQIDYIRFVIPSEFSVGDECQSFKYILQNCSIFKTNVINPPTTTWKHCAIYLDRAVLANDAFYVKTLDGSSLVSNNEGITILNLNVSMTYPLE